MPEKVGFALDKLIWAVPAVIVRFAKVVSVVPKLIARVLSDRAIVPLPKSKVLEFPLSLETPAAVKL